MKPLEHLPHNDQGGKELDEKREEKIEPIVKKPSFVKRLGKASAIASVLLGVGGSENQEKIRNEFVARGEQVRTALTLLAQFDKTGLPWRTPNHPSGRPYILGAADNVEGFLQTFESWKMKPYAKDLLFYLAQHYTDRFMSLYEAFKDEPYTKELFNRLANEDPNFLEYAAHITDTGFGLQFIEKAIIDSPYSFFRNLDKYKHSQAYPRLLQLGIDSFFKTKNPAILLIYFKDYKNDVSEPDSLLDRILRETVLRDPVIVIIYYQEYRHLPDAEMYLEKARAQATTGFSETLFDSYSQYKSHKDALEIVTQAARIEAQHNPANVVRHFDYYARHPDAKNILEQAAHNALRQDPSSLLANLDVYKNEPYAEELFRAAALKEADGLFLYADRYPSVPYVLSVIESATLDSPNLALRFIVNVEPFLEKSEDPKIGKMLSFFKSGVKEWEADVRHTIFFPPEFFTGEAEPIIYSYSQYDELDMKSKAGHNLMSQLIRIKVHPDHIGDTDIDQILKEMSLKYVQELNVRHEDPDTQRFTNVADFDPVGLYTLMVYGDEELFTSSFNGLLTRLRASMESRGMSGDELLERVGQNKFRTFIRLCTSYNRFDEFLSTMSKPDQQKLLVDFVRGIDERPDMLSQAVTIADVFSIVRDPIILSIFQKTIKSEYERIQKTDSPDGRVVYGLLAGMFGERVVIDDEWFMRMAEQYQLPDALTLSSQTLFDQDGINTQQHFFYNDSDGAASFESFLSQYRGDMDWQIKDFGSYVYITKKKNSKRIEIYANKSENESGVDDIKKVLNEGKKVTQVIVHRGHSYHALKSIEHISKDTTFISLGSCGGYTNIDLVLSKSPKAHILSTKGTGTMTINDPISKSLNEEILDAKDISWPVFWNKMQNKLDNNPAFKDYMPPHKNLGILFLKAYYQTVGVSDITSTMRGTEPR